MIVAGQDDPAPALVTLLGLPGLFTVLAHLILG